jgi:hypothetical protein
MTSLENSCGALSDGIPLVFLFNHFRGENAFSESFAKNLIYKLAFAATTSWF